MTRDMENDEVVRLWCFAPPALEPLISGMNRRYRWAHIYPVERKEDRPRWSFAFPAYAIVLCENYGEYHECLHGRRLTVIVRDRDELLGAYRKKYPTWSEAKITRAVDEKVAKTAKNASSVYYSVEPAEALAFLNELCAAGPVVLLLADGGTLAPEIGGTHGLPDSTRRPRFHDAYTVRLKDIAGGVFPEIPYWVPVTVTAE